MFGVVSRAYDNEKSHRGDQVRNIYSVETGAWDRRHAKITRVSPFSRATGPTSRVMSPERRLLLAPQPCKCDPQPNVLTPINAFNGDARQWYANDLLWHGGSILLFLPIETALMWKRTSAATFLTLRGNDASDWRKRYPWVSDSAPIVEQYLQS